MKRKQKNGGFSLVELIIVIAIMAVLVGVMAPQYVKYLDRTKKARDCSAIGTVLDACEVIALDPDVVWGDGDSGKVTIKIESSGTSYVGTTYSTKAASQLNGYVPASSVVMEAKDWPDFTIYAIKASDGGVTFDIANDDHIDLLANYSTVLSKRFE